MPKGLYFLLPDPIFSWFLLDVGHILYVSGPFLLFCCSFHRSFYHYFSMIMLTFVPFFVKYVSIHPPPAFGSSPNLEGLALEANKSQNGDGTVSHVKRSRYMLPRFIKLLSAPSSVVARISF